MSELLTGDILDLPGAIARRYARDEWHYEELRSAGLAGLFNASREYDGRPGVSFVTFAYRCVENAIFHELPLPCGRGHHARWRKMRSLDVPARRDSERTRGELVPARAGPGPDGDAESYQALLRLLARADEPAWVEAFVRRHVHGVRYGELCRELGVSHPTLRERFLRIAGRARRFCRGTVWERVVRA